MCVMIIQENQKFPGWDMLHDAFVANPDGAGFMYQDNVKVHIVKGLMTFDAFKEALSSVTDYETRNLVYHFRIGTHGSKDATNTHPFPVTNVIDNYKLTTIDTYAGFAHNGIIPHEFYSGKFQKKHNITDSAATLHRIVTKNTKDNAVDLGTIVGELDVIANKKGGYGDRFVIMSPNQIYTSGTWKEYKGFKVSNLLFTYKAYHKNYFYDFDDDYDYSRNKTHRYVPASNFDLRLSDFIKDETKEYEISALQRSIIEKTVKDEIYATIADEIKRLKIKEKSKRSVKNDKSFGLKNTVTGKFVSGFSSISNNVFYTTEGCFAQKFEWESALTAYETITSYEKDKIVFVVFNSQDQVTSAFSYNLNAKKEKSKA